MSRSSTITSGAGSAVAHALLSMGAMQLTIVDTDVAGNVSGPAGPLVDFAEALKRGA